MEGECAVLTQSQITHSKYGYARPSDKDEKGSVACLRGACATCSQRHRTFCAALPARALEELAENRREITIDAGQTLFEQGEPAEHMFLVTAGNAKFYSLLPDGRCLVHGFAGPGDHLGLSVNGAYAYFATALTRFSVCRFELDFMETLYDRYNGVAKRLLSVMSNELVVAQNQVLTLGRKTALGKVASFLMMMRDKTIAEGEVGRRIYLAMSRADIADFLGMTTETVSRTLGLLEEQGIIEKDGRRAIICHDPDKLAEIAEEG